MKILSLFDGISCARVALERAGIPVEVYYASEIDKYAIQISKKNYPDIRQIGSVVGLTTSPHSPECNIPIDRHYDFSDIDLLIGGSPCQDLSIAKKNRKGLDGERSGLFWEYVRILNEVKPKYFILENVNSMPKEAKELITKTLGVEPIMINAALVSAQNRKRLFWTNIPNVTLPGDRGILLKDILEENVDEKYKVNISPQYGLKGLCEANDKAKAVTASCYKGYGNDGVSIIRVGKIGKGGQGDRIYSPEGKSVGLSALGGGRGAKTGLYAIDRNKTVRIGTIGKGGQGKRIYDSNGKSVALSAGSSAGGEAGQRTGIYGIQIPEATKKGYAIATEGQSVDLSFPNSKTRRGRVGDRVKNIMTSQNIGVVQNMQIRKLTPIECERLQGLPDNYTEGVSNTQRYKALGNAFNVDVVAHILSFIPKS